MQDLQWKTCLVYLGDIIVMRKDFNDHLKNLQEPLQQIQDVRLTLGAKKCSLLQTEVRYIGHKITAEKINTNEKKFVEVKSWPRLSNLHELRSFLGLCTYYHRFLSDFADVSSSLHELTRKDHKYSSSKEEEESFLHLKERLFSALIFPYPILLITDAITELGD